MRNSTGLRSESELFQQFRNRLSPDVQMDINRYLFAYEMYLDEQDPAARRVLRESMKMLEKKYNLEVDHGSN
ncbi:hypothetical protein JJQ72_06440 [Paenibacillus sp. F411]|uniref:hypothetical protein n=1 Tax=Paenibacillus sp. F411 TaxID=2820239 RepID=UPI001AAEC050|nr:hypothetical protein [Paenibacillus sp. F411]MBO2943616.1 hypothetical protein [Paenibacillus sp. F411]